MPTAALQMQQATILLLSVKGGVKIRLGATIVTQWRSACTWETVGGRF